MRLRTEAMVALCLGLTGCSNSPSDSSGQNSGLTLTWFTAAQQVVGWPGTPAVANGLVIFGSNQGLSAFRAASGEPAWRSRLWTRDFFAFAKNIAVGDGRACIADQFTVGCVDIADGHVLWTLDPDSLSGDGETDYSKGMWFYGSRDHKVHAVDPNNGAEHWATDITPEAQFMTRIFGVVVRGDTVFATTVRSVTRTGLPVKGDLVALDRETGRILWRYTTPGEKGGFQGKALLTSNLAIVNDAYAHSLLGIDLNSGQEVWRTAQDESGYITSASTPVLSGDTVFAASTDTQVYAVNAKTGAILWRVVGDMNSLGAVDACPHFLIAVKYTGGRPFLVDRTTHQVNTDAFPKDRSIGSRFRVEGDVAYAAGTGGTYAFRCN